MSFPFQIHQRPAPEDLQAIADTCWLAEGHIQKFTSLTLPMLQPELVINLSDEYAMYRGQQLLLKNEKAWIAGIQTEACHVETSGYHLTLGILFKPWSLLTLTGIDSSRFRNRSIPLSEIFSVGTDELVQQILANPDRNSRLRILENFVRTLYQRNPIPEKLLEAMDQFRQAEPADGIIRDTATRLGISPRTLHHLFRQHTGLSAGKFLHLQQLHKLLHRLCESPGERLTDITYDFHFFDQAHFVRFFKQYTGLTPGAYLQLAREGRVQPGYPLSVTSPGHNP